ncbi:hypothetical protein GE061_018303 [Apolygus lucorum]|uniref:Uncharacterized protein n=1 Tax=Apolygus lucorum TaxID=248454 RepID=A0A6A4JCM9_APOLU|nr:hypothetical protein GE061_018303 [Apolygus lucorum]
MASGHSCYRPVLPNGRYIGCAPKADNNICGGSLLTLSIVQTACHCIARFLWNANNLFSETVAKSVWEDIYEIYPGITPVKSVKKALARTYITHPKCKGISGTNIVYHDFGLIVLLKPAQARGIRTAPVYTITTLTSIWTELMAKKSVCLNVGFGGYKLTKDNQTDRSAPPDLMHGWVLAMNRLECYEYSRLAWRYEDATFFCTKVLPTFNQRTGIGDSGTPVSCDNQYSGISSTSIITSKYFLNLFTISMSTAFTIFENSAEYRESLILLTQSFSKYDPKAKVFLYRPTAPKINQYLICCE